jgi:HPt (histidine-containing phosphotransfer) domain-containing protein
LQLGNRVVLPKRPQDCPAFSVTGPQCVAKTLFGIREITDMESDMAGRTEATPSEAGRKPASRPVDLVHLSRYTLGDRALEREVLELFRAQASIYLERLEAAQSAQEWREAAHSLKGSAVAIGAWRTAAAAERAEASSGEALTQERAGRLREIAAALGEAGDYIGALLADR